MKTKKINPKRSSYDILKKIKIREDKEIIGYKRKSSSSEDEFGRSNEGIPKEILNSKTPLMVEKFFHYTGLNNCVIKNIGGEIENSLSASP